MKIIYVFLGVIACLLIASLTALLLSGDTVPTEIYSTLTLVIGALAGAITVQKQARGS